MILTRGSLYTFQERNFVYKMYSAERSLFWWPFYFDEIDVSKRLNTKSIIFFIKKRLANQEYKLSKLTSWIHDAFSQIAVVLQ